MIKKLIVLAFLTNALLANTTYTKEQLENMITKMVVLGFYGTDITSKTSIYKDLKKYDLGGVILFDKDPTDRKLKKNVVNSAQLQKLTSKLQALRKEKLLISIDQEGGVVQRLKKAKGFVSTPAANLVALRGTQYAQDVYSFLAMDLNAHGINVNFAPVVDLSINPKNSVIVKKGRSFGKDPKQVTKYASIFIDELKRYNVISVLKHFPGHGSSLRDSHKGFVDITKTWKQEELDPYKYFIEKNKVDMIMTAHVYHKELDRDYPATLSYDINTIILRDMLGYKGVLISDDLQMGAISKHYDLKQTLTLAINSGVNLLLFANQLAKPVKLQTIVDTVYSQVKAGKISLEKIVESNKRIDELRKKM